MVQLNEQTANAIETLANLLYLMELEADNAVRIRERLDDCKRPMNLLLTLPTLQADERTDGPQLEG